MGSGGWPRASQVGSGPCSLSEASGLGRVRMLLDVTVDHVGHSQTTRLRPAAGQTGVPNER